MSGNYYSIWADCGAGWEKIDSTTNLNNAFYLLREYQIAFGKNSKVEIRQHGKRLEY